MTVTGDGTYATPNAYVPQTGGIYQWIATYSRDANNNPATTSCGSAEIAVEPHR